MVKATRWSVYGAAIMLVSSGCAMLKGPERALVFPAGKNVWRNPASAPYHWDYDDVTLSIGKDRSQGWHIKAPNSRGTILISHGNGGNIADRMDLYAIFRDLGYDVFAYDYGGYGTSSGKPSEARCYADIQAAWRYLTVEKHIPAETIILYGESLGGGVTCDLAKDVRPRAVVLQSTFLSLKAIGQDIFPKFLVKLALTYRFENDKKIGQINAPILVMHSPEDTIIPYRHGQELFRLAHEPKCFLALQGDHNECVFASERLFREGLEAFLALHER